MGVTIESKNKSIDLGYNGFNKLRTKIAELASEDIGDHYKKLMTVPYSLAERKAFFKEYNEKIEKLSIKYDRKLDVILDFIYASDCGGKISPEECRQILEIIKDYNDDVIYGYRGKNNNVKFNDFKEILKDCVETKCHMEWL